MRSGRDGAGGRWRWRRLRGTSGLLAGFSKKRKETSIAQRAGGSGVAVQRDKCTGMSSILQNW